MTNIGWSNDSGGGSEHPPSHPATMITVADTGNNFVGTEVEAVLAELFTSGSSGKNSIATAITSKGGTVTKAGSIATFSELVTAINNLNTGVPYATGTTNSVYSDISFVDSNGTDDINFEKLVVSGLTFKPDTIFYWENITESNMYYWKNDLVISGYTCARSISGTGVVKSIRVTNSTSGVGVGPGDVTATGFSVPVRSYSISYKWIALKVT